MFYEFRKLLRNFLYTLFVGTAPVAPPKNRPYPIQAPGGANGQLNVDALLVWEDERDTLVLVIDQDLHDVPVWVDWDIPLGVTGIAQHNGSYATVALKIADEYREMLKGLKRILIVTKTDDKNVVHHVPFIVRE